MAYIPANDKKAILFLIFTTGQAGGNTLYESLTAYVNERAVNLKSGRVLNSTSGNSYSVSFNAPSLGRWAEQDLLGLSWQFIEIYRQVVSQLGGTPSDDAIFDAMISSDALTSITQWGNDYSSINYPNSANSQI